MWRYAPTLFVQYVLNYTAFQYFSGVNVWTAMSRLTTRTVKTATNAPSSRTSVLLMEAAPTQMGHTSAFAEQASGMKMVFVLVSRILDRWNLMSDTSN